MAQQPQTSDVRWRWVMACEVVGAVLIGLAFFVEARWRWHGVSTSTFVNLGTAFGLAGVLFLLERRFTRQVDRVSQRAAERAAREVGARLDSRTDALETRLDELAAATSERVQARAAEQDQAVSALEMVSFETVTSALRAANAISALANGAAIVHASRDPHGLRLDFRWGRTYLDTGFGDVQATSPTLTIFGLAPTGTAERDARRILEVEWRPDDDPPAIGEALTLKLQDLGWWRGSETLDWALALGNLQRTIDIAVASRRRDAGAWQLEGRLYELIGTEWAITERGIESPLHRYLLPEEDFPPPRTRQNAFDSRGQLRPPVVFDPPRPGDWADPQEWDYLIGAGRQLFPRGESLVALTAQQSWLPER